jgi:hypothetical protein
MTRMVKVSGKEQDVEVIHSFALVICTRMCR